MLTKNEYLIENPENMKPSVISFLYAQKVIAMEINTLITIEYSENVLRGRKI